MSEAVDRADDVPALLAALTASDPGRPRLTWYDDAAGPTRGERIELSARVLTNWVAKAANLLVDELDIEPGDPVLIALPPHWRAAYWLLAAWSVGAEVVVDGAAASGAGASSAGGTGAEPHVVVTDDPSTAQAGSLVVAVTLPALARQWPGAPLPAGAVDEAEAVSGQPDLFVPSGSPDVAAPALRGAGAPVAYGHLLAAARGVAAVRGWPPGARVLTSSGPADAVAGLLAPLVVDGSVVLVHDPDPDLTAERQAAERVTSA